MKCYESQGLQSTITENVKLFVECFSTMELLWLAMIIIFAFVSFIYFHYIQSHICSRSEFFCCFFQAIGREKCKSKP